jgi:hypothetical protein
MEGGGAAVDVLYSVVYWVVLRSRVLTDTAGASDGAEWVREPLTAAEALEQKDDKSRPVMQKYRRYAWHAQNDI